jgi:PAS domain-containing protein
VVQDPSGIPIYANQATLDYTGLTAEDVIAPLFGNESFTPTTSRDYARSVRLLSVAASRLKLSSGLVEKTANIAGFLFDITLSEMNRDK